MEALLDEVGFFDVAGVAFLWTSLGRLVFQICFYALQDLKNGARLLEFKKPNSQQSCSSLYSAFKVWCCVKVTVAMRVGMCVMLVGRFGLWGNAVLYCLT